MYPHTPYVPPKLNDRRVEHNDRRRVECDRCRVPSGQMRTSSWDRDSKHETLARDTSNSSVFPFQLHRLLEAASSLGSIVHIIVLVVVVSVLPGCWVYADELHAVCSWWNTKKIGRDFRLRYLYFHTPVDIRPNQGGTVHELHRAGEACGSQLCTGHPSKKSRAY